MNAPVCIIGGLNMEVVVSYTEKAPEWGKQIIFPEYNLFKVGSCTNVALPLNRLGVKTSVISSVGRDIYGREIIKYMKSQGMDMSGVEKLNCPTGIAVCALKKGGERTLLSSLGSMNLFSAEYIMRHSSLLHPAKYVMLAGYFVSPGIGCEGARKIFKEAKKRGQITLLDTGWDPQGWPEKTRKEILSLLNYVDIFLPNENEAQALARKKLPEEMAREFIKCGVVTVFIKLGRKGCLAAKSQGIYKQKAFSVEVVNSDGAGDSFNAGVIYGYLRNWKIEKIMTFSNALSAIVISRFSNRYPLVKEVKNLIEEQGTT